MISKLATEVAQCDEDIKQKKEELRQLEEKRNNLTQSDASAEEMEDWEKECTKDLNEDELALFKNEKRFNEKMEQAHDERGILILMGAGSVLILIILSLTLAVKWFITSNPPGYGSGVISAMLFIPLGLILSVLSVVNKKEFKALSKVAQAKEVFEQKNQSRDAMKGILEKKVKGKNNAILRAQETIQK